MMLWLKSVLLHCIKSLLYGVAMIAGGQWLIQSRLIELGARGHAVLVSFTNSVFLVYKKLNGRMEGIAMILLSAKICQNEQDSCGGWKWSKNRNEAQWLAAVKVGQIAGSASYMFPFFCFNPDCVIIGIHLWELRIFGLVEKRKIQPKECRCNSHINHFFIFMEKRKYLRKCFLFMMISLRPRPSPRFPFK